jgi:CIC family chloride channel protein
MGGLTGLFLAGVAGIWIPLTDSDKIVLAAVGMSACFNAVVRAPLTSLLIVFEMTHQFSMVPPLMFCSIVSQAIARIGGRTKFYDALLLQDGHELIRIKPPRDLVSWQKVPVSEIARSRPIVLPDLEPKTIQNFLESYPYQRFPLVVGGEIRGILSRRDLKSALTEHIVPVPTPPVICGPDLSVREVGSLLMESQSGMVLVRNGPSEDLLTVVTLHDLIRAQASFSD